MTKRFEALSSTDAFEFWGNLEPKCPSCGRECVALDLDWHQLYVEGKHDVNCPYCKHPFTVSTSVSYLFSTDEQGSTPEAKA